MVEHAQDEPLRNRELSWRRFVKLFLGCLAGLLAAIYLFVLLVDPYDVFPFSLPIERKLMTSNHRFVAPRIVRSKRFDSLIVGTSTAFLVDPKFLDTGFKAKFANLSMASMTTWEQARVVDFFRDIVDQIKVLVVGIDSTWCDRTPPRLRPNLSIFPEWLYDDSRPNDYLYLLNSRILGLAMRIVESNFQLVPERIRDDGFANFALWRIDSARARPALVGPRESDLSSLQLSESEKKSLELPGVAQLDEMLSKLPLETLKVFVYMPVHVSAQPQPGSREAAIEAECKTRISAVARKNGAKVVDWRISSTMTRDGSNYWDSLHYLPRIGERVARELAPAVLEGREAEDGAYRLDVK